MIAKYIAEQNVNQDADFRVDGRAHLLLEARLVRGSSCRPLAGTGLPVRYCSHRLQAVVFTLNIFLADALTKPKYLRRRNRLDRIEERLDRIEARLGDHNKTVLVEPYR